MGNEQTNSKGAVYSTSTVDYQRPKPPASTGYQRPNQQPSTVYVSPSTVIPQGNAQNYYSNSADPGVGKSTTYGEPNIPASSSGAPPSYASLMAAKNSPSAPPPPSAPSQPGAVAAPQPGAMQPQSSSNNFFQAQPGAERAQPGSAQPPPGALPPQPGAVQPQTAAFNPAYSRNVEQPRSFAPPPVQPGFNWPGAALVVTVEIAGHRLQTGVEKPSQEYSFHILIGEKKFTTPHIRFSKLKSALEGFAIKMCQLSFPSSHLFANYRTNMQNVKERASELRAFLQTLLNFPGDNGSIVGAIALRKGLQVSPEAGVALAQVAKARRARKDAELAQERARQAAIARTQREDYNAAQNLNHTVRNAEGIRAGTLVQLKYPRRQSFTLKNKFWGWGDATITGPGGYPWLKMIRTNPSLFNLNEIYKNCHFIITNMAGEPMLILQETFAWMDYKYDLYRIDPKTNVPISVCHIRRHWTPFAFAGNYSITLYGFMASHPPITCNGKWPYNFTLYTGAAMAATVEKKMFSFTDTYRVTISPHQDVLLFLGIACAIDRIHHEIEDRRARN